MELGMVIHPSKCPSEKLHMLVERNSSQCICFQINVTELPVTVNPMLFLLSFTQVNWWFTVREKNVVSSSLDITILITESMVVAPGELLGLRTDSKPLHLMIQIGFATIINPSLHMFESLSTPVLQKGVFLTCGTAKCCQ